MNLEVLRILSRIASSDRRAGQSRMNRAQPALRMLACFLVILLCALSRNALFTGSIIAAQLVRLALRDAGAIAACLRSSLTAAAVCVLFLLPAIVLGIGGSSAAIVMKVFASVLTLSLLNEDLSWKEITAALGQCHVPGIFILTLDMTVRFLVILGRYSGEILEAVTLRRVGEKNWRSAQTGGVLGITFLKSRQMAEQTSEAMACRCWRGEYKGTDGSPSAPETAAGRSVRIYNVAEIIAGAAVVLWFLRTQTMM